MTACSATTLAMAECLQKHPEYYDVAAPESDGKPDAGEGSGGGGGSGYKDPAAAKAATEGR